MSDLRIVIGQELDAMEYGEWQNRDLYDDLPEDEKVLAENILDAFGEVGPFDETENIWVTYMPESENEDSGIGVKCENCAFRASEDGCVILAQEIEPGGRCRFVTIPPGYVGG